jgi:hypothetical protein
MSNHAIRRVGISRLLLILAVPVVVAVGRRLITSRNDRVGITPIPIP